METFASVALKTPFNESFLTYGEGDFQGQLKKGMLVSVPLGKRTLLGVVLKEGLLEDCLQEQNLTKDQIKDIQEIVDPGFILPEQERNFFSWVAKYYHYPLGQLFIEMLPSPVKRMKDPEGFLGKGESLKFSLNFNQEALLQKITSAKKGLQSWLLHGVTGSGKTAIYLKLIQKTLLENRSVLFLLPEINLSPQFVNFIGEYVSCNIYTYNSSLKLSQKYLLWRFLLQDETPKIIIGVRSSIFLPIKNLGLIIVDEEHDSSFKQDELCPYNARDLAYKKAQDHESILVLGSATPSLETFYRFKFLKPDHYLPLRERVGDAKLPDFHIVDMKSSSEQKKKNDLWPFHEEALKQIEEKLRKKEQVVVFINRLGYASFVQCRACGKTFDCLNCSVPLKYFKQRNELNCLFCNFKRPLFESCPDCGNLNLLPKGFGTEKVLDFLQNHFPSSVIERFDRDEIKNTQDLHSALDRFHQGDIDIFVGTQMLSKGHNFKKVNLVVILGIDSQLNFPDYRAQEKVYQTIEQISGRSGRFSDKSEVLLLTNSPGNKIFEFIQKHDFDGALFQELDYRQNFNYPPFSFLGVLYLTGKNFDKVRQEAFKVALFFKNLREKIEKNCSLEILGPRAALVEKRSNKFTWTLVLRTKERSHLHLAFHNLKYFSLDTSISYKIDIDPYFIA